MYSGVLPLAFADEDRVVEVIDVRAGRGLARRLMELGIVPGAKLLVVRGARGGPVVVKVLSSRLGSSASSQGIALSFGIACKVIVRIVR